MLPVQSNFFRNTDGRRVFRSQRTIFLLALQRMANVIHRQPVAFVASVVAYASRHPDDRDVLPVGTGGQLTRRSSFVGRRLAAHTLCSLEASVSPLLRRRLDGVVGALRDRVAVQVRGGEHLRSKGAVAARDGARDCAARDHFGRERCCACVRRRRHGRRSRDLRGHCASSAAGGPQLVRSVRGELLLGVVSRWRTPRILCLTRSPVAPSSFPHHHDPLPLVHPAIIANFNHKCTFQTFAEKPQTRQKNSFRWRAVAPNASPTQPSLPIEPASKASGCPCLRPVSLAVGVTRLPSRRKCRP